MMISLRKSEFAAFNDAKDLEDFVRYLTRTDAGQKWTNANTSRCLYAIRKDDGSFMLFKEDGSDFHDREDIFTQMMAALQDDTFETLGSDIIEVCNYLGDEGEEFDEELKRPLDYIECLNVFNSLVEDFTEDEDVLVAVMHNDQKYGGLFIDHHIHRIVSI